MARHEIYSSQINIDIQGIEKAAAGVKSLRDDVIGAVADINKALGNLKSIKVDTKATENIANSIRKSSQEVQGLGGVVSETSAKIKSSVTQVASDLDKTLGNAFKRASGELKVDIDKAAEAPNSLGQQFDKLREVTDFSSRSVIDRVKDIGVGFSVLRSGENTITGIRTALFGIGPATTQFGKNFDTATNLIRNTTEAVQGFIGGGNRGIAGLQNQVARTAERMSEYSTTLRTQINVLKDIHAESGGQSKDLTQLGEQARRLAKSYKDVQAAAASGSKIDQRIVRAQIEGVQQLTLEYENLIRRGVIKQGTESDRVFRAIIEDAKSNQNAVRLLEAQQNKYLKALDKTKDTAEKSIGVFGRLRNALLAPFKALIPGQKNVDGITRSFRNMPGPVGAATRSIISFKDLFLASFGGNLLANLVQNLLFSISRLPGALTKLASDAEESGSKFNVVFGETAEETERQLGNIASTLGRSRFALKDFASAFQDTFVPLGFARDQASGLSTALTQLTIDVASFNNKLESDVARDFQSAIVGNHETVRKYGIIITEAALGQELMNLGLAESSRQATEQQKVLARLSLITKGSGDAIGDAARTADSWANSQRTLGAIIKDTATDISNSLLPAIAPFLSLLVQIAREVGPAVVETVQRMSESFFGFATALSDALSAGDIETAIDIIIDVIANGIGSLFNFLDHFLVTAFNWGAGLVVEIANGIIDTASQVIVEAANYIGELMSAFLAPGSPPEKGPLSDIDQWAKGLVDTFSTGFQEADFTFMEDVLKSVSDAFTEENFDAIKSGVTQLVDEINRTGDFSSDTFEQVAAQIGEGNKELRKTLELQFDLQKARKRVADIEKEVANAEKAGFVPKALRDKLNAAKAEEQQAEKNLGLQQKFLEFQKLGIDDFKKASVDAAAAARRSASASIKATREAVNKNLEFIKDGFAQEKALLDEKLRIGAISQEEYLRELIKLEEKYIDASLKEGLLSGLDLHVESLQKAREELEALTGRKGAAEGAGGIIPEGLLDSILAPFAGLGDEAEAQGEGLGSRLLAGLQSAFRNKSAEVGQTLRTKIAEIIDSARRAGLDRASQLGEALSGPMERLSQIIQAVIDNIKAFVTGFGLLLAPLALFSGRILRLSKNLGFLRPVLLFVRRTVGRLFPVIKNLATKAIPVFRIAVQKVLPFLLRFGARISGIITAFLILVEGIRSNKDLLVRIFNELARSALDMADRFLQAIDPILDLIKRVFGVGEDGSVGDIISAALALIDEVVQRVLPIIQKTFEGVFNAIYGVIQATIIPILNVVIGLIALFTGEGEVALESFQAAWQSFSDGINNIVSGLLTIIDGLLITLLETLSEVGVSLLEALGLGDVAAQIAAINDAIFTIIRDTFGTITDTVSKVLSGEVGIIQGAIQIKNAIVDMVRKVGPLALQGIITNMQAVGRLIGGALSTAIDFLVTNVPIWAANIWSFILGAISTAVTFFQNNIAPFVDDLLDKFVTWFNDTFASLEDNEEGSFGSRLGAFLGNMVGLAITFLTDQLPQFILDVVSFISSLANQFNTWLEENYPGLAQQIGDFLKSMVSDAIEFLTNDLPIILAKIGLYLIDLGQRFITWTEEEGPGLLDQIGSFFVGLMNDAIDFLVNDLPNIIASIGTFLADVGTSFISGFEETASERALELSQKFLDLVQGAIDFLVERGPTLAQNLQDFLSDLITNLLQYARDTATQWATDLQGVFSDWFNQTFDKTDEDAPTLGYRLGFIVGSIIRSALDFFLITIPAQVEKFKNGIQNIFSGGLDEFENGAPDLATRLGEVVGLVIGGIFVFFTQQLPAWITSLGNNTRALISGIWVYLTENKEQIAQNIWDGIKAAIETVFSLFEGGLPSLMETLSNHFSGMLTGAIDAAKKKVPEPLRNLIGLETDEIASDANKTADDLGSAFSTVGDDIAKPVEEGTEKSKGFFQGLYDAVWGESIVPDMIAGITLGFTNMSVSLDAIVNNMILMMQNSFARLFTFVTQGTTNMQLLWTTTTTIMSQAIILLEQQVLVSFEIIRATVQIVIDTLKSLNDEILKTIELIAELAGLDLSSILDAFEKLEDSMQRTRKLAKEFAKFMKDAQDSAGKIGDDLGGNFDGGSGGGGGFQGGLFRVPRTMSAVLHQDELVANRPVAEALRSLFSALELHGIGSEAFSLRNQGGATQAGPQNNYITANFPNVTSAREADGIVDALNSLIDRGRAFARAGG